MPNLETSITVTFGEDKKESSRDSLKIEVGAWEVPEPKISYGDFFKFVGSQYVRVSDSPYDLANVIPPSSDCSVTEGRISIKIYVYRSSPSMAYTLHTSYGSLGSLNGPTTEINTEEEIVNFSIEDSYSLPHSVASGNVNGEWIGSVYDGDGNVISPPTFSVEENDLILSRKVYGSLKISYAVQRDVYTLTTMAYEEENANLFDGVAYAVYSGGIAYETIDSPPSITSLLLSGDVECGWQWSPLRIIFEDRPLELFEPPEAPKIDTEIKYDYCSGDLISITKRYNDIDG